MEKRSHKAKFFPGRIIRRKTHSGTPVGSYLVIQHVEKDRVYADRIGQDSPNEMFFKDNVYLPSIDSVCVSEDLFERLRKGFTICAQHPATTKWMKIYSNPPELIRFFTSIKNYQAIYVLERVTKVLSLGEKSIRIIVSNRVL